MTTKTAIYVYAEHATLKGRVANVEPDDDGNITDDVFLYGEGTEAELVAQAIESLARPCSAAPHFRHTCDRAVLRYLNGPEMNPFFEAGKGVYWLPAQASEDDE